MLMTNAGAKQMEAELKGNLATVGITLPESDKLTFKQVSEPLSSIRAAPTPT